MIPLKIHKVLIFRALKRLKVWEDAEDAVQNAYLLYLRYQKKLDTSNPEKVMNWLVDQEVIRIWRKNNGVTSKGKQFGKMLKFEDMAVLDMKAEDEIVSRASYVAYNEGEVRFDIGVLTRQDNQSCAKYEYMGQKYAEKEFVLTENPYVTKYGTYMRIALTNGMPKKRREIKCYKYKG
jgi:hypothetical protein